MTTFDGLLPGLRRLLSETGIEVPSEIQEMAIPRVLGGENVLVVAPTGVGKTESAVLPILHRVVEERMSAIAFLYVTPLRALNRDMLRRFESWGEALGISVAVRHGDTTKAERRRQAVDPPEMLITTPETLQVMLTGRRLREALSNVRFVVVDEIHELASDERGAQMSVALQRLERYAGDFQRVGISATVSNPETVAAFLGGPHGAGVVKVPMPKEREVVIHLVEPDADDRRASARLSCSPELAGAIGRILGYVDSSRSTLIFCNTREAAEGMASRIALLGRSDIGIHHGSLSKDVREEMEDSFKRGGLKALIATSSLELGIDVGSIETVIQYNSPRQVGRLVQRIGRSGHGIGRTSKGVIVCTSIDEAMESAVIARRAGIDLTEPIAIRPDPLAVLANQLTAMTLERAWPLDEAFGLVREAYPFRALDRAAFDDVVSMIESTGLVTVEGGALHPRRSRTYFQENISMIPDSRTFVVRDAATRKGIGALDEQFVVNHLRQGESFVMRGASWKVVEMGETDILVSMIREVAPLPSWIGEEIPVPYEVAQEVGRLRMEIAGDERPIEEAGPSEEGTGPPGTD